MAYTQENGHSNVVYDVSWDQMASLQNQTVSVSGSQLIPFSDNGGFIPSDQLTEEIVIGWVKQSLGDQALVDMKNQLDALLDEKINPKQVEIFLSKQNS